jgi:hypothetical protein
MLAPLPTRLGELARRAQAPGALTLRALSYRRVTPSQDDDVTDLGAAARSLGRLVADERARCCGAADPQDYVISSTILSMLLLNDSECAASFIGTLADSGGRAPDWMTCSYECAGWGYVLRRTLAKAAHGGARSLLLQIVDVDVHGYSYWHANPMWGNSGFGVCTLLLDVEALEPLPLCNEAATPAGAMVQMGRELRSFCAERPGVPLALPFFPAASRRALLACVGKVPLLPEGHARFGHSFGSDPWISLLLAERSGEPLPPRVIVNSLALNGYYSIAEIALAGDARFSLEAHV